jgi:hypothetical protein
MEHYYEDMDVTALNRRQQKALYVSTGLFA